LLNGGRHFVAIWLDGAYGKTTDHPEAFRATATWSQRGLKGLRAR